MTNTNRCYYRTGRKTLRDGKAHGWNWSTPSQWNNLMHTRPQRTKARLLIVRVMRDPGAADGLVWPLDRKPHKCFW